MKIRSFLSRVFPRTEPPPVLPPTPPRPVMRAWPPITARTGQRHEPGMAVYPDSEPTTVWCPLDADPESAPRRIEEEHLRKWWPR